MPQPTSSCLRLAGIRLTHELLHLRELIINLRTRPLALEVAQSECATAIRHIRTLAEFTALGRAAFIALSSSSIELPASSCDAESVASGCAITESPDWVDIATQITCLNCDSSELPAPEPDDESASCLLTAASASSCSTLSRIRSNAATACCTVHGIKSSLAHTAPCAEGGS